MQCFLSDPYKESKSYGYGGDDVDSIYGWSTGYG